MQEGKGSGTAAGSALELVGIRKHFGGVAAVSDIDVGFDEGTVTCMIGPNGAGKTTLFNIICGAVRPDAGDVRYHGRSLRGIPTHRIARMGVGRLFQDVRVFEKMTLIENVCAARQGHPGEKAAAAMVWPLCGGRFERENEDRAMGFLCFVGLEDAARREASQLSYGQQKLLAIARLLNNDATCLLLDEPTAGVNPVMIAELLAVIRRLADQGRTVVIIEHNLNTVREIGDWVYLMDRGRVEAFGSPDEVLRDSSLARLMPDR